jgi:zinc D-Ala-D-Ala carboxypeptidase
MNWAQALPYFPVRELECKCGCGTVKLDTRFAALLPALRQAWGRPLTPTSVCRCPKHNAAVGGHPRSLHLTENSHWPTTGSGAADISWRGWPTEDQLQFARLAHSQGLRVGLHNGFIHVDIGRLLGHNPRPFVYGEWSAPFRVEDVL